jgi:hypothetical protein
MPRCRQHGSSSRGVCAVGIEHHRHPHWPEERFFDLGQERFAGRHVRSTHEQSRVLEVVYAARKYRAVDQISNLIDQHAAVSQ